MQAAFYRTGPFSGPTIFSKSVVFLPPLIFWKGNLCLVSRLPGNVGSLRTCFLFSSWFSAALLLCLGLLCVSWFFVVLLSPGPFSLSRYTLRHAAILPAGCCFCWLLLSSWTHWHKGFHVPTWLPSGPLHVCVCLPVYRLENPQPALGTVLSNATMNCTWPGQEEEAFSQVLHCQ